jgi:hypothetical protein
VYYTDFATQKPRAQSREAACASAPTIWAQSDSQPSLGNGTIVNSEAADSQVRERNERPLRGEGERNRQRKKIRGNPTERNPGAQRKDRFGSGKARTLRCFTTTTTDDKCGAFQNRNGRVWGWMRMEVLSSANWTSCTKPSQSLQLTLSTNRVDLIASNVRIWKIVLVSGDVTVLGFPSSTGFFE